MINSFENREILLKGTTRKFNSKEGGFLNFLRLLMKAGLPLMKNILAPLAKNVLLPIELSAGMSAADAAIQNNNNNNNNHRSGIKALIISNEEMEDIIKIVKSPEESGLLIKGISETIKNETKQQKGGSLPMLLGTLAESLLGSTLLGKGVIGAGQRTIRASQDF